MKKSIYKILSVIMIIAISLTLTVFAEGEMQSVSEAVYTIGTVEGEAGKTVDVPVTYKTTTAARLATIILQYDASKLEFTGFTWDAALNGVRDTTLSNFNITNKSILTAFTADQLYDGVIGTIQFKIAADATGDIEVTANSSTKTAANAKLTSSVVAGKVTITGQIADVPEMSEENKNTDPEDKELTEELTSEERAEDVICLKIDNPSAFANGKYDLIDSANDKVVPYIKNDRTLVPLRFVSETLGAQVEWENGWNYCYVNKGDKKIKITFGSADIEVNGDVVTYDAPVEVVQGRTMVPIRFISEELGYHVYWNQPNRVVIITPKDNPWVEKRSAESTLLLDVLVSFLMKKLM